MTTLPVEILLTALNHTVLSKLANIWLACKALKWATVAELKSGMQTASMEVGP